ncbi:hypothetical protein KY284_006625 [Solanum tuberosum]|nr:hypothetical protein KY284_006625 [Solanum tuberosum]
MGSACCVAARDRAVLDESSCENLQRNVRQSPTWSFRWDNRGRVAGEETPVNWSSDGIGGNDGLEFKSGTTVGTVYASEEGSPLDSFRSLAWQKSPVSERNNRNFSLPLLDHKYSSGRTNQLILADQILTREMFIRFKCREGTLQVSFVASEMSRFVIEKIELLAVVNDGYSVLIRGYYQKMKLSSGGG